MRLSLLSPLLLLVPLVSGCARETPAEHAAALYAASEIAAAPPHGNLPDFSLPPATLAQAQHLTALGSTLHFCALAWSILQLLLLFQLGIIAWMRDRAITFSRNLWGQAYAFALQILLARALLNLPFSLYGHHLSRVYGFSVQRWPSWFADFAKGLALNCALYGCIAAVLFWMIGKWPKRWWLAFWAAAVPFTFALVCLTPVLLDPLFNQFEPLALHHPQLSAQLQQMGVPPSRQFLMLASHKTTLPNAYVTGLAASKRVVVWDTCFGPGQSVTPEILWTVGHECGHYVLHHVRNGILIALLLLPVALYLAHRFLQGMLTRFGPRWRISSQRDWGAIALLLLAYTLLNVVQEPISSTLSRRIEHSADIYGEEAIHSLVPDPQTAVRNDMDNAGLQGLNDPNPNPFLVFWTFNHPPTGYRAAFGKAYNPWAPGMKPKYFRKLEGSPSQ